MPKKTPKYPSLQMLTDTNPMLSRIVHYGETGLSLSKNLVATLDMLAEINAQAAQWAALGYALLDTITDVKAVQAMPYDSELRKLLLEVDVENVLISHRITELKRSLPKLKKGMLSHELTPYETASLRHVIKNALLKSAPEPEPEGATEPEPTEPNEDGELW